MESAQQLTLFWGTCREEGVRLLSTGCSPLISEAENYFRVSPFSLKKPRTANIVAHLISVAVFLCRAKPENPTAVTMPGFLCVDHSIVEC